MFASTLVDGNSPTPYTDAIQVGHIRRLLEGLGIKKMGWIGNIGRWVGIIGRWDGLEL